MDSFYEMVAQREQEWRILGEVAFALLLGGVLGLEREAANRPAGVRTHMLMAAAAALLVGTGFTLVDRSVEQGWTGAVTADPIRILQAVIIGASFIGGGTIFRSERPDQVQGLTTAASLLMASGIGIAVALRQHVLATGVTLLVALVLRFVGRVEKRLYP